MKRMAERARIEGELLKHDDVEMDADGDDGALDGDEGVLGMTQKQIVIEERGGR